MSERDKLEAMADRLEGVRGTIILHDMDQAAIIAHLDALIEPIRALAAQQPVEEPVVKPLFTAMGLPEVALPALMQAKELTGCMGGECKHASDCAVHNEPALPAGPCDCGLEPVPVAWMSPGKERLEFSRPDTVYGSHTIPLYTHPQPSAPADPMNAIRDKAFGMPAAPTETDLDALVANELYVRVASTPQDGSGGFGDFIEIEDAMGNGVSVPNQSGSNGTHLIGPLYDAKAITDLRAQLALREGHSLIMDAAGKQQDARITDLRAQLDYSRSVIDGLLRDIQTLKDKK